MNAATQKPVIGLIGGIGAGKSTIATALASYGGRVVAADPIGHEALTNPDILTRISEIWGPRGVLKDDGQVDRKKLGAIVFPSPVERSRLEHLVHPYIGRRIREEVVKAQNDKNVKFVILDAAIMLEAGWNEVCDKLVYVDAPRALRLERVMETRGWSEEDLANREFVQMPTEKKKERADAIVDNSGSTDRVREQIEDLVHTWKLV
jgi:dephospho-CoA kinase